MATGNAKMSVVERDLTLHQRGLVDTCFEEGQYEAAISVLDDIRSSRYKPFPAHIRQLIYIALYPPPSSAEEQLEEDMMRLEPGSPSKVLSRRHKSSLAPSSKATAAAQELLLKFARTNTPEALACALPIYPENPNLLSNLRAEEEDSYIAQQALRVRNARCCWDIIKEGFIQRGQDAIMSSPRKGRVESRRSTRSQRNDFDAREDEDCAAPTPVGEHAWSVLRWMLTIFENNEASVERTGQVRHSPLLLGQIPPSRAAQNAPRWEVEMPLDVAFHSLQQETEAQRSLGVRLLSLLVNLTSTILLDFPMFLNAVSNRVSSLSIDGLSYLFASLPITRTVTQFKILLCRHALGGSQSGSSAGTRPKPQARARAQPRRRTRTAGDPADMKMDDAPPPSTSTSHHTAPTAAPAQDAMIAGDTLSIARTYPAITASDVLALLTCPSKSDSASLVALFIKSELVLNYALWQREIEERDRDIAWQEMLRDGVLNKAVEDVFGLVRVADAANKDYVQKKRSVVLAIISMW